MLTDEIFFREHLDRRYRIRGVGIRESEAEFLGLGAHDVGRRRIIAIRAPANRAARRAGVRVMCIPFLLFADETIEDRDDVLGPIVKGIMEEARREYGL